MSDIDDLDDFFDNDDVEDDIGGIENNTGGNNIAMGDRKEVVKTSIVAIIIGFIVIIVGFFIMGRIYGSNNVGTGNVKDDVGKEVRKITTDFNKWHEFKYTSDIEVSDDTVKTVFNIRYIKNFVNKVGDGSTIMVKSVLYGTLNGFNGIYEIEVPYDIASKLDAGDKFNVTVRVGNFNDKTVILEIIY